ncbi:amino acid ABC transporter permease [Actinopolymorpha singaporensis]
MSTVLFDVPGPVARRRHRIGGVIGALVLLALLGFVLWKLWAADQITPKAFEPFADPDILRGLGEAIVTTLTAAAVAIVLALVFGAVFAAGRLSDHAILRWPSIAVIEFFRAIPLVLLILAVFLGFGDVTGRFWALVLALMLYNGSVLAEVFRAGIKAVPRGQSEAAYALGLRKSSVMLLILVPQAVTTMLPAIISQCVVALKDTALGYIISSQELASFTKQVISGYNNPIAAGAIAAAVYIVINYTLSRIAQWLEARQRRRGRAVVPLASTPAGDPSGGVSAGVSGGTPGGGSGPAR